MADENTTPEEEKKEEAPVEKKEEKKESVELSKDAQKVLDMVKKMSLIEVADLVKAMEDEFGVSAAAPVAMAMPAGGGDAEAAEEKSAYDVELTSCGSAKIAVIKAVKELTGLGLKEAKDIVDSAPKNVLEGAKKEDAEAAKAKLEEAGATVTLN